jgi:Raf kinase inhibitor-like YbhB/YbcL family protein
MKLISKDFIDTHSIPSEFTCEGRNISPHLAWENVPDGTKSFALSFTDPDAIGGWNHCLLYNKPNNVKEIEKNRKPESTGGRK